MNVDLIEHIADTIRRCHYTPDVDTIRDLAEAIVRDLPADATLRALHAEFAEAHADGASSNDIAQLEDMTPERQRVIDETNAALAALKEGAVS